jgi:diguanylate cyclase (GGDEF)-like protein
MLAQQTSTLATTAEAPVALLATRHTETQQWGRKWLERYGFQVSVATSLEDVVGLLATAPTDVVVVDGSLRDRAGLGPSAALRRLPQGSQLPLLVLCSDSKEAHAAVREGGTDVARKPFDWPILGQRAAHMAKAYRASQELARTRSELQTQRTDEKYEAREQTGALDPLTGLPSLKSFEHAIESTLSGNARTGAALAVMALDIDRFKLINETYGRRGGSQVLVQVAERLRACVRRRETLGRRLAGPATAAIARIGGDAFGLMISPAERADEVRVIAQSVLDALGAPFAVDAAEVYVAASVGIALAPADGESAEQLVQRADLARTEAQRQSGGAPRFYTRAITEGRERALKIDNLLRRTLERDELALHYQPLVDLTSGRIVGAEALLRWASPELGTVPPLEFIPFAEETGFMVEVGAWVLRTACRQVREWIDQGLPPIRIATNVSLCQLLRGNLPEIVDGALREARIPASLLELELSERGVLRSDPEILRQLQELRRRGVQLAVDDFGTGDSAIAYLKRFPLDTLKIDRCFVAGAVTNESDAAIASAMIAMAHSLRLRVVAEGVERQPELDLLRGLSCEEFQGFLFSPGVPAEAFRELLAREQGSGE